MTNSAPSSPRTPPQQRNFLLVPPPILRRHERNFIDDIPYLPLARGGHQVEGDGLRYVRRRLDFRPGQIQPLNIQQVWLPPALQRLTPEQMATVTDFATRLVVAMQQLNIPIPDTASYLDQIIQLISADSEAITRQFETASTLEQNLRSLQALSTDIENEKLKGNPTIVHMINYCNLHLQAIGDNPLHNFFNANEVRPVDCSQFIENIQSVKDLQPFKNALGRQIFLQLANAPVNNQQGINNPQRIDHQQRIDAVAQWNADNPADLAAFFRRIR